MCTIDIHDGAGTSPKSTSCWEVMRREAMAQPGLTNEASSGGEGWIFPPFSTCRYRACADHTVRHVNSDQALVCWTRSRTPEVYALSLASQRAVVRFGRSGLGKNVSFKPCVDSLSLGSWIAMRACRVRRALGGRRRTRAESIGHVPVGPCKPSLDNN